MKIQITEGKIKESEPEKVMKHEGDSDAICRLCPKQFWKYFFFDEPFRVFLKALRLKRYYLPNPSAGAGYDTRSIFKRSLTGFNSEFSFS